MGYIDTFSVVPLETILKYVTKKTVAIELNDRPENDFTTLSSTIDNWQKTRAEKGISSPSLFVNLAPRSFYKELVPTQSIDIAYSFAALHFFENIPDLPDGHFEPKNAAATLETFRVQAQADLRKFLKLRAAEVIPGGRILMSLCATGYGKPDYYTSGPGESIRCAILDMLNDGKLSREMVNNYIIPCHFRTLEDVDVTINGDNEKQEWKHIKTHHDQVIHPGWDGLETQKKQGIYTEEHSALYATAMIDWFDAVAAGFFFNAVEKGSGGAITHEHAKQLHIEMKQRASKIFLEKFKDAPVYGSFIYVVLERTGVNLPHKKTSGTSTPEKEKKTSFFSGLRKLF